jgi:uncharacterized membrane protein
MLVTQAIPVAATSGDWNIGGGWWIAMGVCMLFMGFMMFGMIGRHRPHSGGWPRWWDDNRPGWRGETPMDVLERRFAEGTISVEDYEARRKVLARDAGEANGTPKEEPLLAPRAGEGSRE